MLDMSNHSLLNLLGKIMGPFTTSSVPHHQLCRMGHNCILSNNNEDCCFGFAHTTEPKLVDVIRSYSRLPLDDWSRGSCGCPNRWNVIQGLGQRKVVELGLLYSNGPETAES